MRALDEDDPLMIAAVERRDDAERQMDALSRYERSWRDEIARMVARVEGLALSGPMSRSEARMFYDDVQITVEATGKLISEHAELRLFDGWRAASYDEKRNVVLELLETFYLDKDTIELHFRTALPAAVLERVAIPPIRDECLRALEADGWGVSEDSPSQ